MLYSNHGIQDVFVFKSRIEWVLERMRHKISPSWLPSPRIECSVTPKWSYESETLRRERGNCRACWCKAKALSFLQS